MKTIDLHTHTNASDGSFKPEELVKYAKQKGLSAIAVTDHDTVAGLPEAISAGEKLGVEVIPGIEISTQKEDCDIHLLGLFIDYSHNDILHVINQMELSRRERNEKMFLQLRNAGIVLSPGDFAKFGDCVLTRGHFASIIVEKGYAKDFYEAMDLYLKPGRPGYIKRETLDVNTVIGSVHNSGGIVIVAHINQITSSDKAKALKICKQILKDGADGLETIYPQYDDFWFSSTKSLATETGKLESGGSDFHGVFKEHLDLGTGYGNISVPYSMLEKMKFYRGFK